MATLDEINELTAISPLDGRYRGKLKELSNFFSEFALIRYRVFVEVNYALALSNAGVFSLSEPEKKSLKQLLENFSIQDAERIKEIEKKTNHDVKSVELFIKEKVKLSNPEIIHFCLTSEDVNSVSYALMVKDFLVYYEARVSELQSSLKSLALSSKNAVMLSRTHGQPSVPTTFGKEMAVFYSRLSSQLRFPEPKAKFSGAVGNFNAHKFAHEYSWINFSEEFIDSLGIEPNKLTTQIEPHDWMAEFFHAVVRINDVLLDFSQDLWRYISDEYLLQKKVDSEVGSSTMPHKVNPIDFENAEGNIGISNALLLHLASKLQVSRLQRDLSDSTALRNVGVALGHSVLAIESIIKGLSKIEVNKELMISELRKHPEVLAEAYQCLLRKHGFSGAYEKMKEFTRGKKLSLKEMHAFINSLDVDDDIKKKLISLKPEDYVGYAKELVDLGVGK